MTRSYLSHSLSLAAIVLAACTTRSNGGDATDQDIAQYQTLQQQLDTHRTQFLPTGTWAPASLDHTLFWTDNGNGAYPTLSSYDEQSGARVAYQFSIGDATAGTVNYRASEDLIVTTDASNVYQVYATGQANQSVGQFSMTPPSDDEQWWAYAVDGSNVYVMTTGSSTELLRWQPGDSAPTSLFALESYGITVGELWDFDISGNDLVVIESGQVWHLDLTSYASVAVPAQNQLDPNNPISFDGSGILFTEQGGQAGDLVYYSLPAATLTDVSAAIAASSFVINPTFAQAHYYQQNGILDVLTANRVDYIGEMGMFAFDLGSGKVTPLLLSPEQTDLTIDYVSPSPLASGDIYVVGFTSNEGDGGTEGPLYKVSP
jgi:hypothetical protein